MKQDDGRRGYQYGPCKPRREARPTMPVPTMRDRELALRDISEVGYDAARTYSRYVIEYDENPRSVATGREFERWLRNN